MVVIQPEYLWLSEHIGGGRTDVLLLVSGCGGMELARSGSSLQEGVGGGGVALIEPVSATELNEELRLSFS